MIDLAAFADLVTQDHGLSVVVTRRADDRPPHQRRQRRRPPHPVTGDDVVAFISAGGRASWPTCVLAPPSQSWFEAAGRGSPSKAPLSCTSRGRILMDFSGCTQSVLRPVPLIEVGMMVRASR
jgi:hypothetical protein